MPLTKIVNGVEVPLTPTEEAEVTNQWADWVANVKPVLQRKAAFEQAEKTARNFDDEEIAILLAAYDETQRWRIDNTATTPIIDAIQAVFPGQTKLQIGTTIENRAQNYLVNAATALANKIKDGG